MDKEKYKAAEVHPTVLRLHPDLRGELMKLALKNGRSLSKEIAVRLQESLYPSKEIPANGLGETLTAQDEAGEYKAKISASATDRAMLKVFRALPPEKQLALLSLFK